MIYLITTGGTLVYATTLRAEAEAIAYNYNLSEADAMAEAYDLQEDPESAAYLAGFEGDYFEIYEISRKCITGKRDDDYIHLDNDVFEVGLIRDLLRADETNS